MGLLLTGRRIDAQEALAIGLLNEVVAREDLDAAVDRWVKQILMCSPASLRGIKAIIQETEHLSTREAGIARLAALRVGIAVR